MASNKSIKKKVEPYKKNNTRRNIKKGAIASLVLVGLGSLLYKINFNLF